MNPLKVFPGATLLQGESGYVFTWPVYKNQYLMRVSYGNKQYFLRISSCPRPGLFRRFVVWFVLGAYWEKAE